MKVAAVVALLICCTHAQWVTKIDGISLDSLLETAPGYEDAPKRPAASTACNLYGATTTNNPDANPTGSTSTGDLCYKNPNPFRPMSMRTIYRYHRNSDGPTNLDSADWAGWNGANDAETDTHYNTLTVEGVQVSDDNVRAYLVDYSKGNCNDLVDRNEGANNAANSGWCSTIDNALAGTSVLGWNCELQKVRNLGSANKVSFYLPVKKLAMHAHHGSWICLRTRGVNDPTSSEYTNVFTNLLYQVAPRCDADASVADAAHTPNNVTANVLNTYDPFPHSCAYQQSVTDGTLLARMGEQLDTDFDYYARRARSTCCGWRAATTDSAGNALVKRWGVCINPSIQSCCDAKTDNRNGNGTNTNVGGTGKPYDKFREKCCFGGDLDFLTSSNSPARTTGEAAVTSYLDDFCPCKNSRISDYCGSAEQCCTFTKYSSLVPTAQDDQIGRCYDPREKGCCSTGDTFNPGAEQCCVVTGVQSLDVPCPCGSNNECHTNQTCCKQQWPAPLENEWCNSWSNYPSGTGPAASQRCLGQCIDTRYQICCNGVACIDEYERCCNNTCCNRFTETCKMGFHPGSKYNSNNFRLPFENCSRIEALTPFRAILAYFLPIALLVATFLGLAFAMFFAKRMNALNPLSAYEKAMLGLSLLIVAFSWPLYFSPIYKYGIVFAWIAFFTIVAALSGLKRLVAVALFLHLLAIVYFLDPFSGNEFLTLAYHRWDREGHGGTFQGLFVGLKFLWEGEQLGLTNGQLCTTFYDGFFARDTMTEDQARWDNPMKYTYGFCSRGWLAALFVLQLVNLVLFVVLFFTTVVTHVKNVLVKKVIEQNPLHY